ncbi:MAG: hypothetical protein K1W10_07490 [Lachnospiraceae bacterium]
MKNIHSIEYDTPGGNCQRLAKGQEPVIVIFGNTHIVPLQNIGGILYITKQVIFWKLQTAIR